MPIWNICTNQKRIRASCRETLMRGTSVRNLSLINSPRRTLNFSTMQRMLDRVNAPFHHWWHDGSKLCEALDHCGTEHRSRSYSYTSTVWRQSGNDWLFRITFLLPAITRSGIPFERVFAVWRIRSTSRGLAAATSKRENATTAIRHHPTKTTIQFVYQNVKCIKSMSI